MTDTISCPALPSGPPGPCDIVPVLAIKSDAEEDRQIAAICARWGYHFEP